MGKEQIKLALQLAGNEHKFQKTLVVLICIVWMSINFILLGSTLIYMDPIFTCGGDDKKQYSESQACARNDCQIIHSFTMTSALGLYCDLEWARDMIQSVFSLGSFAGLIVMNLISDTKGRRISTLLSLGLSLFGVILAILGGIFNVVALLIFAQFLGGFGAYALVALSYTLLYDFCSDKYRPNAVVIVNTAWSVSTIGLGVSYLLEINWLNFLLYIVLIPLFIVSVSMYKFLDQSPYILMSQNKKYQALEVLTKIAILNGRSDKISEIREIIQTGQQIKQNKKPSFKNVFKLLKQWVYLKPIILLTIIYGTGNLNFYGISYCLDNEGAGYGINNIIAGCVEVISFSFLHYVVNKLPRRIGISGFYFLVMLAGLLFLVPAINDSKVIGSVLIALSKIFSTVSYTMIACMQTQSFTVEIQSTAVGFIEAFSLYGGLLAPLIVDLSDKIGLNPIVLISICVNFATWPTIFLKETLVVDKKTEQLRTEDTLGDSLISENPEESNFDKRKLINTSETENTAIDQIGQKKHGPYSSSTLISEDEAENEN